MERSMKKETLVLCVGDRKKHFICIYFTIKILRIFKFVHKYVTLGWSFRYLVR